MKIKVIVIAMSLLFCYKAFSEEKRMPNVIYLNGPSSSGKTTLAKELQESLTEPYLYLSIDQIIDCMPQNMNNWKGGESTLGFSWQEVEDAKGESTYRLRKGPLAEKICQTFKEMASLLISEEYNLIIDDIALEIGEVEEWKELLKNYSTLYVGVKVPLDVLEEREKIRGDRMIGSARGQYFTVHQGVDYDLMIDTHEESTEESVKKIKAAIESKAQTFQEVKKPKSQFAVIYRTYLKPGMEEAYKTAWEKIATYFVEKRGAIGSCLHQASDGMWVAYSRWPDSKTRDASWPGSNAPSDELPLEIRQAIVDIRECLDLERKLPDICLDVVNDLLLSEK